ncbi:unnamed protein product [Arabis nemorensis]|uniref:RING-type E3 ubiquitin transferase n=1 Tax=Arabis nemorensis TaxID=586526 RepID=A0A565B648_9BRAS|nr:unnamed protein product [Arabis nemorensis]
MVWYINDYDPEPDTFIIFRPVYKSKLPKNSKILFDYEVAYSVQPEADSDGEEDLDALETRMKYQTLEFDRDRFIGVNEATMQATVSQMLDTIDVPRYSDIVVRLAHKILNLEELRKVKRIGIELDIMVPYFPDGVDDDDVRLAVAPAGEEEVEQHLETVVVENEGCCVICMDTIRVGSGVETGRMPCMHVFHRTCGENWLRSSGSCPLCRAVFPS